MFKLHLLALVLVANVITIQAGWFNRDLFVKVEHLCFNQANELLTDAQDSEDLLPNIQTAENFLNSKEDDIENPYIKYTMQRFVALRPLAEQLQKNRPQCAADDVMSLRKMVSVMKEYSSGNPFEAPVATHRRLNKLIINLLLRYARACSALATSADEDKRKAIETLENLVRSNVQA